MGQGETPHNLPGCNHSGSPLDIVVKVLQIIGMTIGEATMRQHYHLHHGAEIMLF